MDRTEGKSITIDLHTEKEITNMADNKIRAIGTKEDKTPDFFKLVSNHPIEFGLFILCGCALISVTTGGIATVVKAFK